MDWLHHAACKDEDPELFFPIGTTGPTSLQVEEAKTVCRRCPVTDRCLSAGLDQHYGVWGGVSETERRSSRHRAHKAALRRRP
ncbi:WhiB family transcriptional regulator [Streptomyces albidus (ex Kaewkla and Franco 2022)]|uniref:WhiB family transcriptional regulator n=1 Tax=Streptomyces albidus (ex Kaewkla and Franco 2022) TaxID=722709 RepID=UPI0015EEC701|nr:WhiB family transcriptional regulator [Streptomyces albidus (ex Kaewkla and Franco 2022)]